MIETITSDKVNLITLRKLNNIYVTQVDLGVMIS